MDKMHIKNIQTPNKYEIFFSQYTASVPMRNLDILPDPELFPSDPDPSFNGCAYLTKLLALTRMDETQVYLLNNLVWA